MTTDVSPVLLSFVDIAIAVAYVGVAVLSIQAALASLRFVKEVLGGGAISHAPIGEPPQIDWAARVSEPVDYSSVRYVSDSVYRNGVGGWGPTFPEMPSAAGDGFSRPSPEDDGFSRPSPEDDGFSLSEGKFNGFRL